MRLNSLLSSSPLLCFSSLFSWSTTLSLWFHFAKYLVWSFRRLLKVYRSTIEGRRLKFEIIVLPQAVYRILLCISLRFSNSLRYGCFKTTVYWRTFSLLLLRFTLSWFTVLIPFWQRFFRAVGIYLRNLIPTWVFLGLRGSKQLSDGRSSWIRILLFSLLVFDVNFDVFWKFDLILLVSDAPFSITYHHSIVYTVIWINVTVLLFFWASALVNRIWIRFWWIKFRLKLLNQFMSKIKIYYMIFMDDRKNLSDIRYSA